MCISLNMDVSRIPAYRLCPHPTEGKVCKCVWGLWEYVGVCRSWLGVCIAQIVTLQSLVPPCGRDAQQEVWTSRNADLNHNKLKVPHCHALRKHALIEFDFIFTGSEHNAIHGGARSQDVQRPAVCTRYREPHENGGRQTEDSLGKSTQHQPQELSGTEAQLNYKELPQSNRRSRFDLSPHDRYLKRTPHTKDVHLWF